MRKMRRCWWLGVGVVVVFVFVVVRRCVFFRKLDVGEIADYFVSLRCNYGNIRWTISIRPLMDIPDVAEGSAVTFPYDPDVIAGAEAIIFALEAVVFFGEALSERLYMVHWDDLV